eukprot:scaffold13857_cov76-Skeletonema_dohrnii-CCMP3373.AAC.2
MKGGVCTKHGAMRKTCSSEGCTNISMKGGMCKRHGAKRKTCSSDKDARILSSKEECVKGIKIRSSKQGSMCYIIFCPLSSSCGGESTNNTMP